MYDRSMTGPCEGRLACMGLARSTPGVADFQHHIYQAQLLTQAPLRLGDVPGVPLHQPPLPLQKRVAPCLHHQACMAIVLLPQPYSWYYQAAGSTRQSQRSNDWNVQKGLLPLAGLPPAPTTLHPAARPRPLLLLPPASEGAA